MSLRDIVNQKPITCSPDRPIEDVADLMREKNVGAVMIVQGDKPVGIVTDRDIVLRCVSESVPVSERVDQIMTKTVATVRVDENVQDVVRVMSEKQVRRIPVVDEKGKAYGLISFGDLVGLIAKEMGELSATTAVDFAA